MSGAFVEPIARTEPQNSVPARPRAWKRWPARLLVLLVALWVVGETVSLAIQHTRLRNILTSQIAAAMGRPVEVGSYAFSFWGGPVVEARSVTVGEDPRFGAEYFLRADSMAVRLNWRSLLRGRVEFGTLSLTRPSLNLVRNSSGDWNLTEWLPHPNASPAPRAYPGPVLPAMATRFRRIQVEGGRVNFKLGDEKLPFAFVGVSGIVETDRPGRWRINIQASPWRAAVVVQQAGTLRVSGEVGGTSSRLRPAAFNINWTDASLSDVLRLARGDDFGLRGSLAISIDARADDASADGWITDERVELRQLHRWDLAQRPDNPSLNVIAQLAWNPSMGYVDLDRATLEAPHSTARASGRIWWGRAPRRLFPGPFPPGVSVSSVVDFGDLLAWARAFHPGIADNLLVRGLAQVSGVVAGVPPRLVNASISSDRVDLSGAALREPARLSRLQFRYKNGMVSILPVNLSWGPASAPDGSFRLEAATKPYANALPEWHISGSTNQIRDLVAGADALGWNISRGWDVAGPGACDLRWQSGFGAGFVASMLRPVGWVELGSPKKLAAGAVLRAPFLNLPIEQINARVALKSGARQVKLTSAEAFGARWTGTFDRRDAAKPWHFSLSGDHVSSADLDRWLNPRWRESFLDRMLPFLNSRSAAAAGLENLRAAGRLAIDRFTLAPFFASRLQGNLELDGRHITLKDAVGQFYGGQLSGSLDANLRTVPSYHASLDFSRVDVSALTSATSNLSGLFAGLASGQLSFESSGAARSDLVANLACHGRADVLTPKLETISLSESLRDGELHRGSSQFESANAAFACSHRVINLQRLNFISVDAAIEASGTVGFDGDADLKLQRLSGGVPVAENAVHMTGTLAAPQIARLESPASRRAR